MTPTSLEKSPPPAPFGEPAPPNNRTAILVTAGLLLIAGVVALFVMVSLIGDDDSGAAAQGERSLELTLPQELGQWDRLAVTASGNTGPLSGLAPGAVVGIYRAPEKDPGAKCSPRLPGQKGVDAGWIPLAHTGVPGEGPFRTAAEEPAPAEPGLYNVCGYVEEYESKAPSLLVEEELRVKGEPLSTELGSPPTALQAGVYAASGDQIDGGPPGAKVEFEVVAHRNGFSRNLKYIAVLGLPAGSKCDGDGMPKLESRLIEAPEPLAEDLSMRWGAELPGLTTGDKTPGVQLRGGSPGGGEWHGVVAATEPSPRSCLGHLSVVATKIKGGGHPLYDELKKK